MQRGDSRLGSLCRVRGKQSRSAAAGHLVLHPSDVRSAPHGSSLLCGTAVRAVATAYAYGERFCIIIDDMGRLVLT